MPHDKIRAAARKRMTETGEPYAAARRAALAEHQGTGQVPPPPGPGYALRMSGEIYDWLADLRGRDPRAARHVAQALVALMTEGPDLGEPLAASTADSWPEALVQGLDQAYQEKLDELNPVRAATAEAATLVKDIQDHAAELESASNLASARRQAAEMRRLLPAVIEARIRLGKANQQLQARAEAFRIRKEVLKASYVSAQGRLEIHRAIAASGLADDDDQQQDGSGTETSDDEAALADAIAQMERALGQQGWPEGLMELWPGAPVRGDLRILFAVWPVDTVLLIAVLEGRGVVQDQFPEAVMAAADILRKARAGEAPEAASHGYDDLRAFLDEFYPGTAGDASA